MGDIEPLKNQISRTDRPKTSPPGDPTEWRPRPNPGYDWVDANVTAETMRSTLLRYQSLVGKDPMEIAGMEANARGELIRAMEHQGISPDERGIRVHWALVVEGHGFRQPEGFIHPEAPDDVQRAGREAWKRCVEMASDSMARIIFVKAWRRKKNHLASGKHQELVQKGEPHHDSGMQITGTSEG